MDPDPDPRIHVSDIVDPDLDPDPAIFIIKLPDAFKQVFLFITF
jgi:hypothetical protein